MAAGDAQKLPAGLYLGEALASGTVQGIALLKRKTAGSCLEIPQLCLP